MTDVCDVEGCSNTAEFDVQGMPGGYRVCERHTSDEYRFALSADGILRVERNE